MKTRGHPMVSSLIWACEGGLGFEDRGTFRLVTRDVVVLREGASGVEQIEELHSDIAEGVGV